MTALLDDEDAGVTNVEWQWYRLTVNTIAVVADLPDTDELNNKCEEEEVGTTNCYIDGATTASYTPTEHDFDTANDAGRYLAARARYNDTHNEGAITRDCSSGRRKPPLRWKMLRTRLRRSWMRTGTHLASKTRR